VALRGGRNGPPYNSGVGHIDETATLPCWLDVDLDAVSANVRALQQWIGPDTQLAAVLKAEAYGTGARALTPVVQAAGAQWLAVARVHEGVELREAGATVPILVLNRTELDEAESAVTHNLAVTVDTPDLARALGAAATRHATRAAVHLKVDTGLRRFGVAPDQALSLARAMSDLDGLDAQALYTHFASADEADRGYTLEQLARFERVTEQLAGAGYRFPMRHAANSAATLSFRKAHFDLVRVGLTLYGVCPTGVVPDGLALAPALSFKARIARITDLAPGDGVGYGQIWHAERPTRVALVTAGYADGVRRAMSNRGCALVHGERAPIIGRVSMDQTTLDISSVAGLRVGDVATFFGHDGEAALRLDEFAAAADTIPHEALTGIGGRVARVYRSGERADRVVRLAAASEVPAVTPALR
jgi:alanine racemase